MNIQSDLLTANKISERKSSRYYSKIKVRVKIKYKKTMIKPVLVT